MYYTSKHILFLIYYFNNHDCCSINHFVSRVVPLDQSSEFPVGGSPRENLQVDFLREAAK